MSLALNDVYIAIRGLRFDLMSKGLKVDDLEAVIVHTDDLRDMLCQTDDDFGIINYQQDAILICGIKVIESPHVQRGSIFRVFKNDKPFIYPPNFGVPESGLPKFNIEYGVDVDEWTSSSYESWTEVKDKEPSQPPAAVNKKKGKRKKKKKHSQTRKIELD